MLKRHLVLSAPPFWTSNPSAPPFYLTDCFVYCNRSNIQREIQYPEKRSTACSLGVSKPAIFYEYGLDKWIGIYENVESSAFRLNADRWFLKIIAVPWYKKYCRFDGGTIHLILG